jgi:tetratricopeptide (TPR) repeat protein
VNAIRPLQMATRSDELSNSPEAWYSLATCLKETGDVRGSQRTASTAADLYLEQAHLESYDLNKLLATLRAFVLAAREEEAADRLLELIPQWPEEGKRPQLIGLLGELHAERCKRLRTKEDRSAREFAEAMSSIMRAIQVAPQNRVVIEELVQLTCSPAVDGEQLDRHLTIAQDSGVASGVIHFIRGTRLQLADPPDTVTADLHFRIAEQDGFNMPGLWNNMADAMFENGDADLDKALGLVNRAIQAMPDQPYFFDTRGKILLRQQKSVEAIADLERALAAPELRESIHVRLAEAWSSLGNDAEAERHRELAEQLGQANTARESERTENAGDEIAPSGTDGINQPLPAPDESSSPIEQTVVDSLK